MNPLHRRWMFVGFAAVAVGMLTWSFTAQINGRYLSVSHSVSQQFRAIPSEDALADYCYRLSKVEGVTGVSYRDYSPASRTARVTVFYDPQSTSVRQLRIFMQHTRILW